MRYIGVFIGMSFLVACGGKEETPQVKQDNLPVSHTSTASDKNPPPLPPMEPKTGPLVLRIIGTETRLPTDGFLSHCQVTFAIENGLGSDVLNLMLEYIPETRESGFAREYIAMQGMQTLFLKDIPFHQKTEHTHEIIGASCTNTSQISLKSIACSTVYGACAGDDVKVMGANFLKVTMP